jgi:starch synthase
MTEVAFIASGLGWAGGANKVCDVLVVPKKPLTTGYSPLKLYEYITCGRPILVSRVAGLEFVEEREIGAVFEPGNVSDLFNS